MSVSAIEDDFGVALLVATPGAVKYSSETSSIQQNNAGKASDKKSQEAISAKSVLGHMLKDLDFTDVIVYVGHDEEPFHLHRAVICQTSEFFKAACKPGLFKEGIEKEIELPSIHPTTFRKVISWQYQQGYETHWTHGFNDYIVFKAADFLQIQGLREEVLKGLGVMSQRCNNLHNSSHNDIQKFVDNFAKICGLCCNSDLRTLAPIANEIGAHWKFEAGETLGSFKSGAYGSTFAAVMLEALALRHSLCYRCGF
ncbi:hypothetical protein EYR41_011878 [Orbilia oligospora]|uniref:Uncharacterized protein n=1 Tax=Orbilia oligospora TaxID=2813651 RepID=A0A7C8TQM3_ORBOL|nr:hypothetical protein TWF751_003172 [Orbilia oligospora]TGJ62690.1 hypothetical protein EYR41_011878 [Orbilia oligospora]